MDELVGVRPNRHRSGFLRHDGRVQRVIVVRVSYQHCIQPLDFPNAELLLNDPLIGLDRPQQRPQGPGPGKEPIDEQMRCSVGNQNGRISEIRHLHSLARFRVRRTGIESLVLQRLIC